MNQHNTLDDPALDAHLRRVLHEVAAQVDVRPTAADAGVGRRAPRSPRTTIGAIAIATIAVAGFAAWNTLDDGEIERIPVETAILSGTTPHGDWWLLPSVHSDVCGNTFPGVEVVTAANNQPGLEWDTAGLAYGEPPTDTGCFVFDEDSWLSDPTRLDYTRTRAGRGNDATSDWISAMAVHPDADSIEVSIDGSPASPTQTEPLPSRPTGPRYVAFTVPHDTNTIDITLLDATGQVLAEHHDEIPSPPRP